MLGFWEGFKERGIALVLMLWRSGDGSMIWYLKNIYLNVGRRSKTKAIIDKEAGAVYIRQDGDSWSFPCLDVLYSVFRHNDKVVLFLS